VSDDDVKGYEATEDKLEREPQRGARDEGQAPWSLDLPPLPIRVARPRCKECGLQKRGPILDYVGVDGKECAYEVKDTWTACFKCDMGEHTSQVTRDNASGTVNRRHNMAREWRGREDEANACEGPIAVPRFGELDEVMVDTRDPLTGDEATIVYFLRQGHMRLHPYTRTAEWTEVPPDAFRNFNDDVPAFSIHDRYTEDTWLPGDAAPSTWEHMSGSGEPRRPYLKGDGEDWTGWIGKMAEIAQANALIDGLLHDFSNATGATAEPLTLEKLQEAITAFEALPPANALPLMWTAAWPDDEST
jgi:hypothetical protein